LKEVGLVLPGSTSSRLLIEVLSGAEEHVKEESLVVVDSEPGRKLVGVLRGLTGARRGEQNFLEARVEVVGVLSNRRIEPVYSPAKPGSRVYLVESPSDIGGALGEGLTLGVHPFSGVPVSLSVDALTYNIAVVGSPRTGKSELVRRLLREVLTKTSWRVVVFDHTGSDYAPYWSDKTIPGDRVSVDLDSAADALARISHLERYSDHLAVALAYQIASYIAESKSRSQKTAKPAGKVDLSLIRSLTPSDFDDYSVKAALEGWWSVDDFASTAARIADILSAREEASRVVELYLRVYGAKFIESLNRLDTKLSDIVDRAMRERIAVVDLSTVGAEIARAIVKGVILRLLSIAEESGEPLNTLIVVDEAQNYVCVHGCSPSLEAIEKALRESKRRGLGVVLVSRRIAELSPESRGNIATVLFGKPSSPAELQQISEMTDISGIPAETMFNMKPGEFFLAGFGSPVYKPILLKVAD